MVSSDNCLNTIQATCDTEPDQSLKPKLRAIASACKLSQVGKKLPDAFYIHVSALHAIPELLQQYERATRSIAPNTEGATIIKFSTNKLKISYLFYPDFDIDPHPALKASVQVDLETDEVTYRDYNTSENPFILHRKETFVTPDYPLYEMFAELTRAQEALGLLSNKRGMGTRQGWEQRLQVYGVEIQGHSLIEIQTNTTDSTTPQIERHKAAILRRDLSRPVRLALEANIFTPGSTFFDYGCGHGGDVERIAEKGYSSVGWDPYYAPENPQIPADIVNLGYIINVIENTGERREALINAWELTRKVLIVSAQVILADANRGTVAYGDGIITNRNTFQKFYDQEELKLYINQVLGVEAVPVALGIYFVFRDEAQAQLYRASRFRSRATTPRVRSRVKSFDDYQQLLSPLMSFVTERGRLPGKGELPEETAINNEFGNLRRAFQVILQATDPQEWEAISEKRRQDSMVYLALSKFNHPPKLAELAPEVQEDIKGLFGSYKQAWTKAEEMLYSLGKRENIIERCRNSSVGNKASNSLWFHVSALEAVDPLLRLFEGCASHTIGSFPEANVIKIHMKSPKISYLFYPDFDSDPHPLLHTSMIIDLRDLQVNYREFNNNDDPPILHFKDTLVTPDYPLYEKFARLTCKEQDWGLLDDLRSISHRSGWLKCLEEHCVTYKGYQIVWQKDADPYKLKALRAAVQTRQAKRRKLAVDC
jgi:DNA phosphorothioation-associated putative methyltransferase